MRAVRRAVVVALLLAVGFDERVLALPLLLAAVQPIVNADGYGDVLVKRVGTILLIEFVLDFFLEAVIEQVYKPFLVDLGS